MDVDAVRKEVERFDPATDIAHAWTPPASWYTDPDFDALERTHVFGVSWQPVARVAQLTEPGAFVSGCLAGDPYVITRAADGALRAFHNTCRHKATPVAVGDGTAERLVCPYHGWSYDLDGRLRTAPRMAGIKDFDRKEMSLRPMAMHEWGPWLWLNPAAEPPPFPALTELSARLDSSDWRDLTFVSKRSWTLQCNWKVYVDNYLDGGYHIEHMHPSLDDQLSMDSYKTEVFDTYSIQGAGGAEGVGRIGAEAIYAWLFPAFMINRYGPCMDTNHVIPLGPGRCRVDYEFWFADPNDQAFIEQSVAQADITQQEDIEISESVQVGLRSSSYDRGRYAPGVEIGEHHFHRLLAAHYKS